MTEESKHVYTYPLESGTCSHTGETLKAVVNVRTYRHGWIMNLSDPDNEFETEFEFARPLAKTTLTAMKTRIGVTKTISQAYKTATSLHARKHLWAWSLINRRNLDTLPGILGTATDTPAFLTALEELGANVETVVDEQGFVVWKVCTLHGVYAAYSDGSGPVIWITSDGSLIDFTTDAPADLFASVPEEKRHLLAVEDFIG